MMMLQVTKIATPLSSGLIDLGSYKQHVAHYLRALSSSFMELVQDASYYHYFHDVFISCIPLSLITVGHNRFVADTAMRNTFVIRSLRMNSAHTVGRALSRFQLGSNALVRYDTRHLFFSPFLGVTLDRIAKLDSDHMLVADARLQQNMLSPSMLVAFPSP